MGAWGYGVFEDDSALDFLYDLEEEGNLRKAFKRIFNVKASDLLDYDEGISILVAASLIDSVNEDNKYEDLYDEYSDLMERVKETNFDDLKSDARRAVQLVLSDISELRQLWEESGYYVNWKSEIEELLDRLK